MLVRGSCMHHNTTDKQLLIRYVDLLENPVNSDISDQGNFFADVF